MEIWVYHGAATLAGRKLRVTVIPAVIRAVLFCYVRLALGLLVFSHQRSTLGFWPVAGWTLLQ